MNNQTAFIAYLCIAEVLTMSGTMFFPSLLPAFQEEWNLTNTEAGWINGIFFAGYTIFVPILVSLTDRADARRIYLISAVFGAFSVLGFGFMAKDTASAMIFRFCQGVSLAGTFMPGLRALSDRITGYTQSRAIAFYTSSYGIGTAASVFLSGLFATWMHWRYAAALLALLQLTSVFIFNIYVRPIRPNPSIKPNLSSAFQFRSVLQNKSAIGYILGYGVHCFELFGFRSWLVAFLTLSISMQAVDKNMLSPHNLATLILIAGVFASVLGNEAAQRWERRRVISIFMVTSGIIGCFLGFFIKLPYIIVSIFCLVYGIAIMLDSGSLTAGIVASSHDYEKGKTLALYSFVGFGMAFLSPILFGMILDLGGNGAQGWGFAFAAMGIASISGPIWLWLFRAKR